MSWPVSCEQCGYPPHVTDSRPTPIGRQRRNACGRCGHRWGTIEITMAEYERLIAPIHDKAEWSRGVENRLQELLGEVQTRFMPSKQKGFRR